jgi:autotransporter-associated beta strand protein
MEVGSVRSAAAVWHVHCYLLIPRKMSNPIPPPVHRMFSFLPRCLLFRVSLWCVALLPSISQGGSFTWNGGGDDDNWQTPQNWSTAVAPTLGSDADLHFAGSTHLAPVNDFASSSDISSIFFDSGAGAFNVSGNSLNLFGKIENNSANAQTLSISSLSINSAGNALNPVQGDLTLSFTGSGANIFNNGNTVNVYGNQSKTLTLSPSTVITGAGGFYIRDFTFVVFNSAQTYTGTTTIDAGRLAIASTVGNNTGAIILGNASARTIDDIPTEPLYANTPATLYITSSGLNLANNITTNKADTGSAAGSGSRLIDGIFSSGISILSGTVTLNGGLIISQSTGGILQVSGAIVDGTDTGFTKHEVIVNGSGRKGTVLFTANNTYTGRTVVNGGTLEVNNNGSTTSGTLAGSTQITVIRNATLLLSGSGSIRDRLNNSASLSLSAGTNPDVGGTLHTGGLSEGTAPTGAGGAGAVVGLGALSLRANTTIDFTSAIGGSELVCQSLSFISGIAVNILHWTGTAGSDGQDRLLFATNPNLTTNDLRFVQFTNDAGLNFETGAMIVSYNGYYELVPMAVAVPEPGGWAAAAFTVVTLMWRKNRRQAR